MKNIRFIIALGAMFIFWQGYGMESDKLSPENISTMNKKLVRLSIAKSAPSDADKQIAKEYIQILNALGDNMATNIQWYKRITGKNPLGVLEENYPKNASDMNKKLVRLSIAKSAPSNEDKQIAKEYIQALKEYGENMATNIQWYKRVTDGEDPLDWKVTKFAITKTTPEALSNAVTWLEGKPHTENIRRDLRIGKRYLQAKQPDNPQYKDEEVVANAFSPALETFFK